MTRADEDSTGTPAWWIYRGTGVPSPDVDLSALPGPPAWRTFTGGPVVEADLGGWEEETERRLGSPTSARLRETPVQEVTMVNTALLLRRPLLVTGRPGTGKSALAYKIGRELGLGRVLRWPVSSRSTLEEGLWEYDAIGRVQAAATRRDQEPDIGEFVHLGPLGTALLPCDLPRVLLIDELDKSDIDLPNDLLSVFEDGEFAIRPLVRIARTRPEVRVFTADSDNTADIRRGRVACKAFPIIIITSNDEREFPPAFLRRCLRLTMPDPTVEQLANIVAAHFHGKEVGQATELIRAFVERSAHHGGLAADQLLNSIYMATSGAYTQDEDWRLLCESLWHELGPS
ncbi:AAA family ATPase [Umezawaea endophytica]|uniref:MoxR family ATPase n=1 Tax=Umezawaea endophytica TaxID=1654476 RepID=A0A9X3AJ08_9PSEU|nr:MoxR family ATPase [Umezawaea endophytica]MCS7483286.1 MoxR family ATPase [Umezawaea endophytica]